MIPFSLPPAETHLSFPALFRGLFPLQEDFQGKIKEYLGVDNCVLAANARTLLYLLLRTLREQSENHSAQEVLLPGTRAIR